MFTVARRAAVGVTRVSHLRYQTVRASATPAASVGHAVQPDIDEDVVDATTVASTSTTPTGAMSTAEYRAHHTVQVHPECPAPYQTFDMCTGFTPRLQGFLKASPFKEPTVIQAQAWPIALQEKDMIGVARTGSGKTLGYLLPAINQIMSQPRDTTRYGRYDPAEPQCIVLAPTRELAQQIEVEARKVCSPLRIGVSCLYGGASKQTQERHLQRRPALVVATPGRLLDFMDGDFPAVSGAKAKYIVLDEADRMLDMGFEPQITDILKNCPAPDDRQTMMFTATWPKKVQEIARRYTGKDVEKVVIDGADEKLVANKNVQQIVRVVDNREKLKMLIDELKTQVEKGERVMIFAGTKRKCDELDYTLGREGFSMAGALHGDKSQGARNSILEKFRRGYKSILCATDVAARGIDVPDVKMVVVYDFPTNTEDYIHRIGRTGRAGKSGKALTFLTQSDSSQSPELRQVLVDAGSEVPEDLEIMAQRERKPMWSQKAARGSGGQRGGRGGYRGGNDRYQGKNQRGGYNDRYQGNNQRGGYNDRYQGNNGRYGGSRGGQRSYDRYDNNGGDADDSWAREPRHQRGGFDSQRRSRGNDDWDIDF